LTVCLVRSPFSCEMSLRADAPAFVPSAAAVDTGLPLARGDQLIQELAALMSSSPDTQCCMLPAAGIFCPYCIAGVDCAFHKCTGPAGQKQARPSGDGNPLSSNFDSRAYAQVTKATRSSGTDFTSKHRTPNSEAMLKTRCTGSNCAEYSDLSTDPWEKEEEASTDAGGSEGCAASDASDSFPTPPECAKRTVRAVAQPHIYVNCLENDIRAHHSPWSTHGIRVHKHIHRDAWALAR